MKKVLFVFNHPAPYKVALFNGLSAQLDLHVIFERDHASNRNPLFYNESNTDYKFVTHKINGINLGEENFLSTGIKKHLKHNKYDLIVMNGYSTFAEMIALRYLKKKKIPYIFYINGGVVKNESKLKTKIKRYFINGANKYLSPSVEADEYLIHYGVNKDLISHYPYATVYEKDIIKKPLSIDRKEKLRLEYGIKDASFVFMSVGQFIDRKNNLHLLEVWRNVSKKNYLVLIGDGPEKSLYEQYIKDHEMNNVVLIDFLPHEKLLKTLRIGDYAVFLSKEDIYGHMVNEAMSQGLGVVASNKIVSARTLIKDGVNGYLVDCYNEEMIMKKIKAITKLNTFEASIASAKNNTIENMVEIHAEFFAREL